MIDATCPLVAKVHAEARRFAAEGQTIFLIGHDGHEEVEGTHGRGARARSGSSRTSTRPSSVEVADPERVAYLTQTTLAVDETDEIVDALRERFPALRGPAVRRHLLRHREPPAGGAGRRARSPTSCSSSARQTRRTRAAWSRSPAREGARAYLVDDETEVDVAWLAGAATIAITAGVLSRLSPMTK